MTMTSWSAGYERQAEHLLRYRPDCASSIDAGRRLLDQHAIEGISPPGISVGGQAGEITLEWHRTGGHTEPGDHGDHLEIDILDGEIDDVYVLLSGELSSTMDPLPVAKDRLHAAMVRLAGSVP